MENIMKEVELINAVGAWAEKQPWSPRHAPELGVIEEIGEAAHAELKHFQNIRGMGDLNAFHDAITDAWGDAMIFLSHWCFINNAYYQFDQMKLTTMAAAKENFPNVIQHLLQAVSAMFTPAVIGGDTAIANLVAGRICQGLTYWACKYDFDLRIITESTWLSVKERDWNKIT